MRQRQAPLVGCRGGCGRKRRTWRESWLCRFCLLADRQADPEPFRATQRRLNGRCEACGLSPCGCEPQASPFHRRLTGGPTRAW